MAALLTAIAETGITTGKFSRLRGSDGAWWNTSGTPAYEAYNAANIASYGIDGSEIGATGVYSATDPTPTVGGEYLFVKAAGALLTVADLTTGLRWQNYVEAPIDLTPIGTGARVISVTVVDSGATPLEGVLVRLTKGAKTYIQTTDVDGEATFNVDDGTWVVAATLHGYSYAGSSLVVDGDEPLDITMTDGADISASDPGFVTGYVIVRNVGMALEAGASVSLVLTDLPLEMGTVGISTARTAVSDAGGVASWINIVPGASYTITSGGTTVSVKVPTDAEDEHLLVPSFVRVS